MGWFHLDYCIHAANTLLLAAYSVRDILWLRVFAAASSIMALPYFLFQPQPLWAAFGWSILFTGINVFQAWRLYRERRPVQLTEDEEEVRKLAFRDLPPRELLRVIGIGSWKAAQPGERLIERAKPVGSIYLIVRGKVRISGEEEILGEMGPGQIVGSALLLSGAPSAIDAVTVEPGRTLSWEVGTLQRYLDAHPETRIVFQRHIARDLASKLQRVALAARSEPRP